MSNMSYCRFENTYRDLLDCYESLNNEGGIEGVEKDANEYEKPFIRRFVELCGDVLDDYKCEL